MPKVACYVRVSTEDQSLERQLTSTTEYAQDELGADPGDCWVYRDKSTGTNTDRSGYREMINEIEAGTRDAVVCHEISRMARSLQDLERTVERVTANDCEIHFIRDGLAFGDGKEQPMQRLQMQMLGAFSEWQARVKQMNTREGIAARQNSDEEYHHGRPPLGFEKKDGRLIESDEYGRICTVLALVDEGEMSKREAADELGCVRATIRSALEKGELYGL